MSGTLYNSDNDGDWGNAAIWSTDSVPNSASADVTIDTAVIIAAGESFTADALDVASAGLLLLAGALEVVDGATVDGHASLDGGTLGAGGGLVLPARASSFGGSGTIDAPIDNAGLIFAANGVLDLAGSVAGSGALEIDLATGTSATLELAQGGTEAVAFVGLDPLSSAQGVLKLDDPAAYSGTISGFTFGEAVDLAGIAPGSLTETFSGNPALGTLTIAEAGSTIASLTLAGDFTQIGFTLSPDGAGGTDVRLVAPASESAVAGGDWRDPAIWSAGLVPNNATTAVDIAQVVTIAAGESFVAGAVDVPGVLDVAGSLGVAGGLTIDSHGSLFLGSQFVASSSGAVSAGSIDVAAGGTISGSGTIAASGTFTNDGTIENGFVVTPITLAPPSLTLAPAIYQQGTSGILLAERGTLLLAPATGADGFANLVGGTLSGGSYEAAEGTLSLPDPVSVIENALVSLEAFGTLTAGITAGGAPLEQTLGTLGSNGFLSLSSYDYTGTKPLTIDGGRIDLFQATLDVPSLTLTAGASELSGTGTVTGGIANEGRILAGPTMGVGTSSVLDLAGSVSGGGTLEIAAGATLELGLASAQGVTFDALTFAWDAPEVLQLDIPGAYDGTISGFEAGLFPGIGGITYVSDAIDLPGLLPGAQSEVYNGTTAGGVLNILAPGTIVAGITFAGDYTEDSFRLVSDGHGGTVIELVVPCFARGTRLATPAGQVAVEHLRVGERVLTASGEARPIVWIGQRRVHCAGHKRPELVRPVRVRAGAFGAAPVRDLLLSPDHSIYVEGVLVPIKHLVNGATIVQEPAAEAHYFHIELDRHDVVLAEGLPAESYLDTGNRAQFAAGGAAFPLHADFAAHSWNDACAKLTTEGPAVLATRRRLLARAAELGYTRRSEPEFSVLVGGRPIRPEAVRHKLYTYLLPPGAREVQLVSSVAVPAGLDPADEDCRTLGARVGAVFLDGNFVPLDSPILAAGFHRIERKGAERWRWTDGGGVLLLPEPAAGPITLELLVRDVMAGWAEPAELALAA